MSVSATLCPKTKTQPKQDLLFESDFFSFFFFLKCFDTTWKICTLHAVLTSAHVHEACLKMQTEYSTDDFHSCRFYFLIGCHEIIYRPGHIFINNWDQPVAANYDITNSFLRQQSLKKIIGHNHLLNRFFQGSVDTLYVAFSVNYLYHWE